MTSVSHLWRLLFFFPRSSHCGKRHRTQRNHQNSWREKSEDCGCGSQELLVESFKRYVPY